MATMLVAGVCALPLAASLAYLSVVRHATGQSQYDPEKYTRGATSTNNSHGPQRPTTTSSSSMSSPESSPDARVCHERARRVHRTRHPLGVHAPIPISTPSLPQSHRMMQENTVRRQHTAQRDIAQRQIPSNASLNSDTPYSPPLTLSELNPFGSHLEGGSSPEVHTVTAKRDTGRVVTMHDGSQRRLMARARPPLTMSLRGKPPAPIYYTEAPPERSKVRVRSNKRRQAKQSDAGLRHERDAIQHFDNQEAVKHNFNAHRPKGSNKPNRRIPFHQATNYEYLGAAQPFASAPRQDSHRLTRSFNSNTHNTEARPSNFVLPGGTYPHQPAVPQHADVRAESRAWASADTPPLDLNDGVTVQRVSANPNVQERFSNFDKGVGTYADRLPQISSVRGTSVAQRAKRPGAQLPNVPQDETLETYTLRHARQMGDGLVGIDTRHGLGAQPHHQPQQAPRPNPQTAVAHVPNLNNIPLVSHGSAAPEFTPTNPHAIPAMLQSGTVTNQDYQPNIQREQRALDHFIRNVEANVRAPVPGIDVQTSTQFASTPTFEIGDPKILWAM